MGIAEGIETALSAMEVSKVTVWAACGSRLADIQLPAEVKRVVIFADNGAPGVEAAEKAKAALLEQGRRVAIAYPPVGKDWNDAIRSSKVADHA
jgi:putative DNA primase/helicase